MIKESRNNEWHDLKGIDAIKTIIKASNSDCYENPISSSDALKSIERIINEENVISIINKPMKCHEIIIDTKGFTNCMHVKDFIYNKENHELILCDGYCIYTNSYFDSMVIDTNEIDSITFRPVESSFLDNN